MTQKERREFLIKYLIDENRTFAELSVPQSESEQITLLRALMNVRSPMNIGTDFLNIQDEYLKERAKEKG
ncbi:MAG: protein-ADP-ribose hydrolase, partial [Clostridia bacterium]|nr:protein-ADP-ribose hydrolase [Clostridia bacterium]